MISLLIITLIVVTSFWIFKTTSVLVCPAKHRLSREPPDPRRGRVTTPRPLYPQQPLVNTAKNSAAVQLSVRGSWKGALAGTGLHRLSRAPPDPPRPRDHASPALPTAASVNTATNSAAVQPSERGASKDALAGTGLLGPRYVGGS